MRVENPQDWPFSVHGRVVGHLHDKTFVGSGTIIGTRYVLTAAHMVYYESYNQEIDVDSIRFIPAMSGSLCTYGEYSVVKVLYPEEYRSTGQEDFAILVLDREVRIIQGFSSLINLQERTLMGVYQGCMDILPI